MKFGLPWIQINMASLYLQFSTFHTTKLKSADTVNLSLKAHKKITSLFAFYQPFLLSSDQFQWKQNKNKDHQKSFRNSEKSLI